MVWGREKSTLWISRLPCSSPQKIDVKRPLRRGARRDGCIRRIGEVMLRNCLRSQALDLKSGGLEILRNGLIFERQGWSFHVNTKSPPNTARDVRGKWSWKSKLQKFADTIGAAKRCVSNLDAVAFFNTIVLWATVMNEHEQSNKQRSQFLKKIVWKPSCFYLNEIRTTTPVSCVLLSTKLTHDHQSYT